MAGQIVLYGSTNATGANLPLGGIGNSAKVVTVNPTTGEADEAGAHVYGYDASGNLVTDTWTVGYATWVKTYSYTSGNLTGETDWVKQ